MTIKEANEIVERLLQLLRAISTSAATICPDYSISDREREIMSASQENINRHREAFQKLAEISDPLHLEANVDNDADIINRICDAIEEECLSEDFDYDRRIMKHRVLRILNSYRLGFGTKDTK